MHHLQSLMSAADKLLTGQLGIVAPVRTVCMAERDGGFQGRLPAPQTGIDACVAVSDIMRSRPRSGRLSADDTTVVAPSAFVAAMEKIPEYLGRAKDKNNPFRLMGFGPHDYKSYDPRAKVMRKICYESSRGLWENGRSGFKARDSPRETGA
jgi:hypothetical protein